MPDDVSDADAALHLSHGLVGVAEIQAVAAELTARVTGAPYRNAHLHHTTIEIDA